jgi:GTP cyclohydrolase I
LQVQERLTAEIARVLDAGLEPHGVMVIIEAEHTCMTMRGVKKPGTLAVTSVMLGVFRDQPAIRQEALALIGGRG